LLLLPIAEAMAELLCTEDFSNVRVCERPGCGYLFVDRTGQGTRRRQPDGIRKNRRNGRPHISDLETRMEPALRSLSRFLWSKKWIECDNPKSFAVTKQALPMGRLFGAVAANGLHAPSARMSPRPINEHQGALSS
jgi:hypothetical protein